jgi:uncharacterized protein (TIGR03086 family)
MDDIALLSGVLTRTGDLIGEVGPERSKDPTPCPEYTVEALVDHMVGWVRAFEDMAQGRPIEGDPAGYRSGPDPAGEFRTAAAGVVSGWEKHGTDRQVRFIGSELPGVMAFNMTLMEYLAHGWDLAVATGLPVPYTEREAAEALVRAEATVPPQYRGEGMPFGEIVPVDPHAPAVERFVGVRRRKPYSR